jgi:hypothetical protein
MARDYGTTNVAPYASAPTVGPAGSTYYNTGTKVLYISDGTTWNVSSGGGAGPAYAEIQATPPTAATPPAIVAPMGLLWVDTSIANPTTVNLPYFPPQTPPVSGFNSFIDGSGAVWVSRNGSAWKKARDVLHAKVYRAAVWTVGTAAATVVFDTVNRDDYGIWTGGGNLVAPIAGWYSVFLNISITTTPTFSGVINVNRNGTRNGYVTSNGVASSPVESWIAFTYNMAYSLAAGDVMTLTINSTVAGTGGGQGLDLCSAGMSYLGSG